MHIQLFYVFLLISSLPLVITEDSFTNRLLDIVAGNAENWNIPGPIRYVPAGDEGFLTLQLPEIHCHGYPVILGSKPIMARFTKQSLFGHFQTIVVEITGTSYIELNSLPTSSKFSLHVFVIYTSELLEHVSTSPAVKRLRFKLFVLRTTDCDMRWFIESRYHSGEIEESFDPFPQIAVLHCNPRKMDLRFGHFRVPALEGVPHAVTNKSTGKPIAGLSFETLCAASKALNFTYDIKLWGRNEKTFFKHPNGTWGGVIGNIDNGKYDFMVTTLTSSRDRLSLLEYVTFGFHMDVTFIAATAMMDVNYSTFGTLITSEVWFMLTVLTLTYVFAIRLHLALLDIPCALTTAFISIVAPLLNQSTRVGRLAHVRPQLCVWAFSSFLFGLYYSSTLQSRLSTPPNENVPSTFEALAERDDYRIRMIHSLDGAVPAFFRKSTLPVYQTIRRRSNHTRDFKSCIIQAATEKRKACIGLSVQLETYSQHYLSFYKLRQPIIFATRPATRFYMYSVLSKDSKYSYAINWITGWTRDTGLVSKWFQDMADLMGRKRRFFVRNTEGRVVSEKLKKILALAQRPRVQSFGLNHVQLGFKLLAGGVALAVVTFLFSHVSFHLPATVGLLKYLLAK